MRTVSFTVPGEPKGKGRPRFVRIGNSVRTYTPHETAEYERLIRMAWGSRDGFGDRPVGIIIQAYFGIPKSATKAGRQAMIARSILPTKRPDVDNVIKAVADALSNGAAYNDDRQIVAASCHKYYAEEPRLEIVVYDAGTGG